MASAILAGSRVDPTSTLERVGETQTRLMGESNIEGESGNVEMSGEAGGSGVKEDSRAKWDLGDEAESGTGGESGERFRYPEECPRKFDVVGVFADDRFLERS